MKKAMLLLCFASLLATIAVAGTTWVTRCTGCDHTEEFILGGMRQQQMIHGACGNCRRIVTVSWRRSDVAQEPKPVATVWDPMRNRNLHIFNCPHCEGQFIKIENVQEDLKHCLKCQKVNVVKDTGEIVD